jgi:Mg-chelatase subunit ChlD
MKIYKGYQFKSAVSELILKIAKDLGKDVKIVWTEGITTAGITSDGRVYLADVRDDAVLTHNDLIKYCGFGVHELLHALFTNFNYKSQIQYVNELHNAIEDAWIEHKGIARSVTGNINNLLSALIDQMVIKSMSEVTDWADPRQYPFVLAVYLRKHAITKIPLAKGLAPIFAEAANRLDACQSSSDTLDIAQWVYNKLQNIKTPTNPEPQTGSGKPQDGSQTGDQGQGEGEGKGDEENGSESDSVGHARQVTGSTEAVPAEPSLDPQDKAGQGAYNEHTTLTDQGYHIGTNSWLTPTVNVPAKLRYTVKRLFDNSGIDEFQRNRKAGAVNVHALPTVGFNDKLFKRRHEVDGIDTVVAIVIDVSSSMDSDGGYDPVTRKGLRLTTAVQTAIALLDTLKRAGVATTVLSFGSRTSVIKPFAMSPTKAISELCKLSDGGSTNDYFAIRYAHKLLLNRPEQRKITFVLTDGQGDVQRARKQVEIGERLGVTTIGIGIQENVSRVYPNNVRVMDLSTLGAVSFDKMKLAA